jgi:hypothetical protein
MAGQGGTTGVKWLWKDQLIDSETLTSRWIKYDHSIAAALYVLQTSAAGAPDISINMQFSPYRTEWLDGQSSLTTAHYIEEAVVANLTAEILTKYKPTTLDDPITSVRFTVTENDAQADTYISIAFVTFDID